MLPLLLAAALTAAQPGAVARVDDEPISARQVLDLAQAAGLPPLAALETLVRETLLARAARSDGLADAPAVREALQAQRRRLAVQALLEAEVFARIGVTDAEILEAFHDRADLVRLSMVVRDTQAEAVAVRDRVLAGAALIEEAKASSDPLVAAKSGVLGWVARGALVPSLARAAFSVPLLQPVAPVPVARGFAVVLVHERRRGDEGQLEAQRDELRHAVEVSKRDGAVGRFVEELRQRAGQGPGGDAALIEAAALARGYDRAPRVAAALAAAERELLVKVYLDRVAAGAGPASDDAVERRWRERPDDYTLPPRRACVHVVAREEEDAQALRARLDSGVALETVASDAEARRTGHVGPVEVTQPDLEEMARDGRDPALAAAITRTPAGWWTQPVHARGSWTIYRCEAPRARQLLPLERVRDAIAETLRRERAEQAVRGRIESLRARASVRVDESALATLVAARS